MTVRVWRLEQLLAAMVGPPPELRFDPVVVYDARDGGRPQWPVNAPAGARVFAIPDNNRDRPGGLDEGVMIEAPSDPLPVEPEEPLVWKRHVF